MTFYTASFETVTLRFILMMAIIVGALSSGFPILGILGLPVFLLAMMGVSFKSSQNQPQAVLAENKSNIVK